MEYRAHEIVIDYIDRHLDKSDNITEFSDKQVGAVANTKVEHLCHHRQIRGHLGQRDGGSKSAGKTTDRSNGQTAIHIDERRE